MRRDLVYFFLTDKLTEVVRFVKSISCERLRNSHRLFLINDYAVSRLQNVDEFRVLIVNFVGVELVRNIRRDIRHRTRTVQTNACYDFFENGRFQFAHKVFHTAAFKLEHGIGVAFADHLIRFLILVSEFVEVDFFIAVFFEKPLCHIYIRKRFECQKVHFQ